VLIKAAILARLWWDLRSNEKRVQWKSMEHLYLSTSMGGVGFHDLLSFRDALLTKEAWKRVANDELLWQEL